MFSVDTSGLDKLQRTLSEASTALQAINGEIALLRIDPNDPDAEAKATKEIEAAIDRKLAPYKGNSIVASLAEKSKAAFIEAIRKRIEEARAQG